MKKKKVLTKKFFNQSVLQVAPLLLGKFLVRKVGDREEAYMITEVEAYDGEEDLACHASKGRTKRTETLYKEGGVLYVYLCYGIHWMLNIVTGTKDHPEAALIRGLEGVTGPGRVTARLGIDSMLHGKMASPENHLWFEDRGVVVHPNNIQKTARIGVAYAGAWAKKKYRFLIKEKQMP